jgi:hypothetical protein
LKIEKISFNGKDYALILRKGLRIRESTFFTNPDDPMQLGIIRHETGYIENPHIHKKAKVLPDIHQVLHITKGSLAVNFFNEEGKKVGETTVKKGDTILIMSGGHAIKVLEDLECLTVKQGPYAGIEGDKINLTQEGRI